MGRRTATGRLNEALIVALDRGDPHAVRASRWRFPSVMIELLEFDLAERLPSPPRRRRPASPRHPPRGSEPPEPRVMQLSFGGGAPNC